ncbi:PLDc N-terminal domain-containing protein [Rhodococcus sp. SGAir0479]|uniref:PLDc N-terminal domain-containing protein n=1 Tax=Rhodococcus sp. SGAir0479 TaxID=2567884 RepID=UPI0015867252|nr:PLDc N-terminal domain-containing protein [Rhodococcus sp. SGAir0479]
MDEHTATLPLADDLTWTAAALVWLALVIVTTVSVLRAGHVSATAKIAWILIALALPILGPVAWFAFGNAPAARGRRTDS